MEQIGVQVEVHHHEVGTAGQAEIDLRFDALKIMGDKLLKYKYVVKNVARRHNRTVTLMPKPHLPGQRLRDACAPESVEGQQETSFSRPAPTAT